MKEQQMIAKITRETFKKREVRLGRIEKMEKDKVELDKVLQFKILSITRYTEFYDKCHLLPSNELYFQSIVLGALKVGSIKVYHLSQDGLKWECWTFNEEQYQDKVNKGELIFHIPLKKQIGIIIDIYKGAEIYPIMRKINTINRSIERIRHDLSNIQSNEIHKIRVEEAFLNNRYTIIFRELNTLMYSILQTVDQVVKHKKLVEYKHLNVCIQMMRRFNEERMLIWLKNGTDEKYSKTISVTNTYKLLNNVFNILMKMEKHVKIRIRRNSIYIRPVYIASFIREINLFKKHHNKIWIPFYISNIPYIYKYNNFSETLTQHIYEYIFGIDKPIIFEYKRPVRVRRLPQP
jgi:hypothetical protein